MWAHQPRMYRKREPLVAQAGSHCSWSKTGKRFRTGATIYLSHLSDPQSSNWSNLLNFRMTEQKECQTQRSESFRSGYHQDHASPPPHLPASPPHAAWKNDQNTLGLSCLTSKMVVIITLYFPEGGGLCHLILIFYQFSNLWSYDFCFSV